MLGHIRSETLDKFKEAFDKALSQGEGFSVAACRCTEYFMTQFDDGCAGIVSTFLCHYLTKIFNIRVAQQDTIAASQVTW